MKFTDTDLLDWLQNQLDKKEYTGKVIFRWSIHQRGWRLHETTRHDATEDVREAIRNAMMDDSIDEY